MTQPEKSNIAIQQLNLGYHQVQDRLLFRVGLSDDTELALWLTHRMARLMWQLLNNEAHLPQPQQAEATASPEAAVLAFKQEAQAVETLQALDFETAYTPRQEVMQQGPSLVTELTLIKPEHASALLEMHCEDGLNVALNLNQDSVLAICNMLQLTTKDAAWDIGASSSAVANAVVIHPTSKQVLH